jgi:predicted O-methyltransferase YrrM
MTDPAGTPHLGAAHRQAIVSWCRPGGRLVEWGSGWSTEWFARHLPHDVGFTSIEHDPSWHARVGARVARSDADLRLVAPAFPIDAEPVLASEDPAGLDDYIDAPLTGRVDAALVDGVARSALLLRLARDIEDHTVVFLHDAQRDWYDLAKGALHAWGVIGSCPDYPGPTLWYGGRTPHAPMPSGGDVPLVVSYYTVDTPYQDLVPAFRASCQRLGLEAEIAGVPSRGSWEANCATKARVCAEALRRHRRPIVFIDIDAEVVAPLDALRGLDADVALHRWRDWEFASGTVFINDTPGGLALVDEWQRRCERAPDVWDQVHLDRTWERLVTEMPLHTRWLPASYCAIVGAERRPTAADVIRHHQASHILRPTVGHIDGRGRFPISRALIAARQAARPRRRVTVTYDSWERELEITRELALERIRHHAIGPAHAEADARPRVAATGAAGRAELRRALLAHQLELDEHRLAMAVAVRAVDEAADRVMALDAAATAIYGAGEIGLAVSTWFRRSGRPAAFFIDSDPARWGERFDGLDVLSPAEAAQRGCCDVVVASASGSSAIVTSLEAAFGGDGTRPRITTLDVPFVRVPLDRLRGWTQRGTGPDAADGITRAWLASDGPPRTPEAEADAAEASGRWGDAVRWRAVCRNAHQDALSVYRLGSARLRAGLDVAAGEDFLEAQRLTDDPDLAGRADYHLARLHCRAHRWEQAVLALQRCVGRLPMHRGAVVLLEALRRDARVWSQVPGVPVYEELDGPGTIWVDLYEGGSGARRYRAVFETGETVEFTQTRERSCIDVRGPTELAHYERLAAWLQPSWRVLDVAAGMGYGSAWLASKVSCVHSVDVDRPSLQYGRRRHHLTACAADASALPFADGTYDLVVSVETIEHLTGQDAFAASVHRVLVPGGLWYITTPRAGTTSSPFHPAEVDRDGLVAILRRAFGLQATWSWLAEGHDHRGFELVVRKAGHS